MEPANILSSDNHNDDNNDEMSLQVSYHENVCQFIQHAVQIFGNDNIELTAVRHPSVNEQATDELAKTLLSLTSTSTSSTSVSTSTRPIRWRPYFE